MPSSSNYILTNNFIKLDPSLCHCFDVYGQMKGRITYCGHELSEFVPQRTCAYISQHDLHHGEMTVRETLNFSGRCLGVGTRYELLAELSRREKEAGIKPDPEIDAFMKATAMAGQETSLVTDYVLKVGSSISIFGARPISYIPELHHL